MRSEKLELVKSYYNTGLWNKQRVKNAVGKWITAEEYLLVTGEIYVV